LNRSADIGIDRPDWRLGPVATDRLWTVTLHYHAWADALAELAAGGGPDAGDAATLLAHYIGDWITRCPVDAPGARHLAWNAYAVATRITWWIRAARTYPPVRTEAFLRSLWGQAAYLRDHLEYDLRANHLLRDAVGLVWAGRYFAGQQAAEWLRTGARLAVEQVAEQVLPDGGHFERSPMYHLHVMEDVLALAVLVEDPTARTMFRASWQRMAEYAAWVRHPDGQIPLLNDAALNGAAEPGALLTAGGAIGEVVDSRPRRGGRVFPDTGLAVWHGDPWTVFFDVGPIGPDEQPGHAHADTLTVECSYRGHRLFVDPGTYGYDHDTRRRYDRSTAAHNTVCISDTDSSEVWHVFRVGRRARARVTDADIRPDSMSVRAWHDGAAHLPGRPRPERTLAVRNGGALELLDRVDGRRRRRLSGGLLVGDDWRVEPAPGGWVLSDGPSRLRVAVRGPSGLVLAAESRPLHPEFGLEHTGCRLEWRVEDFLPVEVSTVIEPA
jgi:uncharacterized heparinase superfamily protein